ncbi:DHA2 family efflux MFS transporter permease subunit [Allorhizobium sp. BGMRC 0089]|uniref:DHA2 family efflux MFS transporter permease subunit n=1 Tax=Allorhizobium sonneratiae TaxID=2934936 RepID=UPI0020339828|nr:DHA2 family efflux MFS transporter permease subunit [Allorhizobium sonneratiae]MCM2292908.1 DHA2 family efflux MFS transporter permease subunit [Allorhizobium sonneratiae]
MTSAAASSRPAVNPWIIAVVVALASFMEVLDTTIANVALNYISGGLGVGQDEASWVVTTYLVANAVIVTATSYMVQRVGRKRFFLGCLALFTISSVMCGLTPNLQFLLFARILQGIGGGGMVPVAQSILADSFPPEKRSQGFALFGVAVVVAPVVGPTLGGWLSDNLSWHWCFLINAPVGALTLLAVSLLIHEPEGSREERERQLKKTGGFDWIGFGLVATFLGMLELVLDRGLDDDWFGSSFIRIAAVICALAFILTIPWELKHKNPAVDVRMLATRQFGACFLVMMATGALLLATTQYLPQLVQENLGYTATWAGLLLSPGGVVTMSMMFVVGAISSKIQPKYLIAAGAAFVALAMYLITKTYADTGFWYLAKARMVQGIGLPLIFLPITSASYDGLPPSKTDQASALLNAARNTGGSIGVSLISNIITHHEQTHQSRLIEHVIPSGQAYQQTMSQMTQYFMGQGSSQITAQQQALAWINEQVQSQASFLSYIDAFWVLTIISLCAIPLALTLRNVKLGGKVSMGH